MKKGKNTLNVFSVLILVICIIFSSACAPDTAVEDNSASNIPENEAQTSSAVLTSQTTKEQAKVSSTLSASATAVTSAVNAVKMNNESTAKQSSTSEGKAQTSTKKSQPSTTKSQPSTTKAQPSTTKAQPSTTKAQPSTTKAQPSTTKARLVTIKARPSTTKASTTAKATEKSTSTTVSEKADTSNKQPTTQTLVGYISSGVVGLARNMLGIESKPKQSTAEETTTTKPQLPSSAKIKNVPYLNQIDLGYPMGCEAVSGTMVLKFWGYDVTVAQVVEAVPRGKAKYQVDGVWYAADPFVEFVGDPKKTSKEGAYGCFADPLVKGMSKFAGDRVKNISGCSEEELFRHIAEGRPVVVWGASNGVTLKKGVTWQCVDKNGKPTGKTFQQITREHCMVLIGYDKDYVYLNNPSSEANVAQERSVFFSNWKTLYSQAVVII